MNVIVLQLDKQTAKDIEQYAYMVGQTPAEVLNSAAAEYMENWYQAAERKFNELNKKFNQGLKKKTRKSAVRGVHAVHDGRAVRAVSISIDTSPTFLPVAVGQSCDILSK